MGPEAGHSASTEQSFDGATAADADGLASHFRAALDEIRGLVRAREPISIDAVVHRFVHGGARFRKAVRLSPGIREALDGLTELAPLHNPTSLRLLDAAGAALPEVPQVVTFDTAFHTTLEPEAFTYPLPLEITEPRALRRFGFHGLSCAYSASRVAELLGHPPGLRLVVAHLGQGASVTAIADGRSVDTTMGFTPLEGLMMGTRSGSVDPGLLLHLQRRGGMSAADLESLLNHDSGLLGVSGLASDMRVLLDAAQRGDGRASLAIRMFVHRARQAIGAMAVTLGGVDALVFTGGIGEHAATVRAAIGEGLGCLGLELDPALNESVRPDAIVSSAASKGRILVITAREDVAMAREARACLSATESAR
jgi:acetate kinase